MNRRTGRRLPRRVLQHRRSQCSRPLVTRSPRSQNPSSSQTLLRPNHLPVQARTRPRRRASKHEQTPPPNRNRHMRRLAPKSTTTRTFDIECCGTTYHEACFWTWFATLLDSKTIPKCGGADFDVDSLEGMLSARARKQYTNLKTELDAERRVYC